MKNCKKSTNKLQIDTSKLRNFLYLALGGLFLKHLNFAFSTLFFMFFKGRVFVHSNLIKIFSKSKNKNQKHTYQISKKINEQAINHQTFRTNKPVSPSKERKLQ